MENTLENLKEKASYAVGISIAQNLLEQDLAALDVQKFSEGVRTVFEGNKFLLTQEEMQSSIQQFLDGQRQKVHEQNKLDGEAFLAENKKRSDIKTTASGLQYEIMKQGDGTCPGPQETVSVHYHGTLIDGTVFDSSVQRGTPASFGVHQVIPGWTEALQLMSVGAKYKLYIPQELAYGANPHPGGPIKPYSALIFEVELMNIEK
jgi:FKBP-type peptidyl-prolyl cis-trans isomerase